MSFDRVLSYIRRHNAPTMVCVDGNKARCMAADSDKAKRIVRDNPETVIGTYEPTVSEIYLAQDLSEAGVDT